MRSVEPSRVPRPLLFGVGTLTVLLAVLATLQYRWLGHISQADDARLRAGARARAEQLARDFDREVTRAFLWLRVDAASIRSRDWTGYAERRARWARLTAHPGLVKDVWLVDAAGEGRRRFDEATAAFLPAPWPASLSVLRERLREAALVLSSPAHAASLLPRYSRRSPTDLFDDQVPAFFAPIPSFDPAVPRRGRMLSRSAGFTIVVLDLDYIRRRLLPTLVRRHFGADEEADYAVVVSRRARPRAILFRSAPPVAGDAAGDATASLLGLRLEDAAEEDLAASPFPGPAPPPGDTGRRFEPRRSGWPRGAGFGLGGADGGRWRLVATHRSGSVDRVVAAARRRNLAVSAGILALLAVSVGLIVVSSQRARRLGDRQVEFVAGVSHELRTPVAVICSAGENLADGLVQEQALVRQYGQLVRDEGRRLAEMVEQVLDFAGSYGGRRAYRFEEATVADLVSECLAGASLPEAGVRVEAVVEPELPPLRCDRGALRRALQNLVQNAVKYGREGGWVGVRASGGLANRRPEVRITVEDRGPGIPASELPRVFEPFFRGAEASNRQIRGSGLGLSLVKRIAEAHGGRVAVESAPGRGSAFTITLPASPAPRPATAPPEPAPTPEPADGAAPAAR